MLTGRSYGDRTVITKRPRLTISYFGNGDDAPYTGEIDRALHFDTP